MCIYTYVCICSFIIILIYLEKNTTRTSRGRGKKGVACENNRKRPILVSNTVFRVTEVESDTHDATYVHVQFSSTRGENLRGGRSEKKFKIADASVGILDSSYIFIDMDKKTKYKR